MLYIMARSNFIISGKDIVPFLPEQPISTIIFQKLKDRKQNKLEIIEARTGEILKQEDVFDKIVGLAVSLQKFGIDKHDLITIISENSYQSILTTISALLLGTRVQCLNPDYTINELRHYLKIAPPKLVFCSAKTLKNIDTLKDDFRFSVICLDKTDKNSSSLNYDYLISSIKQDEIDQFCPVNIELEEVAMLLSSSGTSGLPKVVETKHCGMLNLMQYCLHQDILDFNSNDIILMYLPFYHIAGLTISFSSILSGCKMVIIDKFIPEQFLKLVEIHRVNKLLAVPPIVLFLAKSPLVDKYDVSSIKTILCGAAPLKKEIEESVAKRLKISPIRQMYGLTEASALLTIMPADNYRIGSVGKLLPWIQMKICDIETNEILGPNQIGEIRVKTRALMKGYCNNAEETKAAFDDDGWLRTGDLGYYDEDDYIYIVDRVKEMIKYKGFQVAPAELEAILLGHPGVKDAGVIGIPDERAGEVPLAFVVKQPGLNVTEDELVCFIAANVCKYKQLYGGVRFIDEIPKSASGKILRRKLRELVIKS